MGILLRTRPKQVVDRLQGSAWFMHGSVDVADMAEGLCCWSASENDAEIDLSWSADGRIVELDLRGRAAWDWWAEQDVAIWTATQVVAELQSDDAQQVWLACQLAERMQDVRVVAQLRVLSQSEHDLAELAQAVLARHPLSAAPELIPAMEGILTNPVQHWHAIPTDRDRCQILRWLAHDGRVTDAMVPVMQVALQDESVDVRASALAVCLQSALDGVQEQIRHFHLPSTTRMGGNPLDRQLLQVLVQQVPALVYPQPSPAARPVIPMAHDLLRALHGQGDPSTERWWSWCRSLVDPVPECQRPEDGPSTERWAWVPPIAAWLSEPAGHPDEAWQCREGNAGFFIARQAEEASRSWDVVDLELLPDCEQWQRAMRGPDGRRYPWGNAGSGEPEDDPSPWACWATTDGEWLRAPDGRVCIGLVTPRGGITIRDEDPAAIHPWRRVWAGR